MTWLAGVLFASALVVLGAGVAKLARPAPVVDALWSARLPLRRHLARTHAVEALAVVEILVGACAIAFGSRPAAAALAVLYVGFAAFSARLAAVTDSGAPCGCFGATDAPVSTVHVVVTAAGAAVAALAATWPPGSIIDTTRQLRWSGPLFVLAVVVGAWLVVLVLTRSRSLDRRS